MERIEVQGCSPRVRANVALTAKGLAQWEVTSEAGSVEDVKSNLELAIDAVRKVLAEKGIKEVQA